MNENILTKLENVNLIQIIQNSEISQDNIQNYFNSFLSVIEPTLKTYKENSTENFDKYFEETIPIENLNTVLRVFRNSLQDKNFQNYFLKHPSTLSLIQWTSCIFQYLKNIQERVKGNINQETNKNNSNYQGQVLTHFYLLIQFFVNFVVNNPQTISFIWENFWPTEMFISLFEFAEKTKNRKLTTLTFIFLYNCLANDQQKRLEILQNEKIIKIILNSSQINNEPAEDELFDWISFLLKKWYANDSKLSLFEKIWNLLSEFDSKKLKEDPSLLVLDEQLILLKFLDSFCFEGEDINLIMTSNLFSFLINLFQSLSKSSNIFKKSNTDQEINLNNNNQNNNNQNNNNENEKFSSNRINSIYLIVQIIGNTTGADYFHSSKSLKNLINKAGLFDQLIELLRTLISTAKRVKKDRLLKDTFVFGFKKEFIRIIGNICFQNSFFQTRVRELGGIHLILNNSNYDPENPYIREWSVFAIRNICEGNLENQNLIEELKAERIAEPSIKELQERGLKGWIENGNIKIKSIDEDI